MENKNTYNQIQKLKIFNTYTMNKIEFTTQPLIC